jgi:hypothetical protein
MSRELSGNGKTTEDPRYSGNLQPLTEQRLIPPTVAPQPALTALEPLPASVLATVTRFRTQTPTRIPQPRQPASVVSPLPTLAPLQRLPVVTPTQPVQLAQTTTVTSPLPTLEPKLAPLPTLVPLPTLAPTLVPLPTLAPTLVPLPTLAPTLVPLPTLAPTLVPLPRAPLPTLPTAPLPTLPTAPLPQLPLIASVKQPLPITTVSPLPTLPPLQPIQQLTQGLIQLPTIQQIPHVATSPAQPTIKLPTLTPIGQYTAAVTGDKVPTIPTNPEAQNQYTRELQLAPLSPRSPRIGQQIPPAVFTHPTQPVSTETCCVCYDEEIPTTKLLGCKHPLCGECISQLQTPECPMCKKFIEGPLVTDEMLINILQRQEQARMDEETANYLAGLYLEENPEADPEEVYARYRNIR